ncbi:MAG: Co-chaperone protein DjlA [Candidatus Erwinia impunctatus]|nr:Co-chaperone protein DjlA [Culicoides impunctatus]
MRYWCKVVALILAFVLGTGFWGGLMLLFVGHLFDRSPFLKQRFVLMAQKKHFLRITFAVMGHLAKVKGRITEVDIQIATRQMDHMRLTSKMRMLAQDAYRAGKKADYPLWYNLNQFHHDFEARDNLLHAFLDIQISAVLAAGELSAQVRHRLYSIAQSLGITRTEFETLLYRKKQGKDAGDSHRGADTDKEPPLHEFTIERAYQVLGVKRADDAATIKRAYRKLMSLHHPDKVAARGLSSHHQQRAKQKSQEIQAAWGVLKRARGFK